VLGQVEEFFTRQQTGADAGTPIEEEAQAFAETALVCD